MDQSDHKYQCSEADLKKLGFRFKGAGRNDLIWLLNNNPSFKQLFDQNVEFWRFDARQTCLAFSMFRNSDRQTQREIDPNEYFEIIEYLIGDDDRWREFTGNDNNLSPAPAGLKNRFGDKLDTNKLKSILAKNALSVKPITATSISS